MNHVLPAPAAERVSCREIRPTDLEEIATLLHEGFPRRSEAGWLAALDRLGRHPTSVGFPRYGYMLDADGTAIGVLLLIATKLGECHKGAVRCNVSSWYVRPAFRPYALFLASRALKDHPATFVNVSPAPLTCPIIQAQGFRRFSHGSFAAFPMLSLRFQAAKIARVTGLDAAGFGLSSEERRLLADHAAYGCISVRCETEDGTFPFVFRRRFFKRFPLPCAQLVYCRDIADLVRFAGPLGRFLALRGLLWVLVAADAPIPGLPGRYFAAKLPMYYRGENKPHAGDLAYTEAALFGL